MVDMERVVKNRSGSFDAYAGELGEHVATCRTKEEAWTAIQQWHELQEALTTGLCSVWAHDPLRGIVDESCPNAVTGDDGLCDQHRKSRARNRAKRQVAKALRVRRRYQALAESAWNLR